MSYTYSQESIGESLNTQVEDESPFVQEAQIDSSIAYSEKARITWQARLKWLKEMMERDKVQVNWDLEPPKIVLPAVCSDEMKAAVGRWPTKED